MQAHRGEVAQVVFNCTRCAHRLTEFWTQSRWIRSAAFRCPRCGVANHVEQGVFTPISPAMLPWTSKGVLSPWYGAEYVPVAVGWYECSSQSGLVVKLYWTGRIWSYEGERVGPIHKWRGKWKS